MNRIQVSLKMEGLDPLTFVVNSGFHISDTKTMRSLNNQTIKENINGDVSLEFQTFMTQTAYDLFSEYSLRCWNSKNIDKTNYFTTTVKYLGGDIIQKVRTFNRCVTLSPLDHIQDFDKGSEIQMKVVLSMNNEQGISQFVS